MFFAEHKPLEVRKGIRALFARLDHICWNRVYDRKTVCYRFRCSIHFTRLKFAQTFDCLYGGVHIVVGHRPISDHLYGIGVNHTIFGNFETNDCSSFNAVVCLRCSTRYGGIQIIQHPLATTVQIVRLLFRFEKYFGLINIVLKC